jgi:hypothetical protein
MVEDVADVRQQHDPGVLLVVGVGEDDGGLARGLSPPGAHAVGDRDQGPPVVGDAVFQFLRQAWV